jgi:hypothetical protein
MREHEVRVQRPGERFPRGRELAWRLAEVASRAGLDVFAADVRRDRLGGLAED